MTSSVKVCSEGKDLQIPIFTTNCQNTTYTRAQGSACTANYLNDGVQSFYLAALYSIVCSPPSCDQID